MEFFGKFSHINLFLKNMFFLNSEMRIEFWIKWDFLKKILGLGLKSEKFEIGNGVDFAYVQTG